MRQCQHLHEAEQAEALGDDGSRIKAVVLLCAWARNEQPMILDGAPRWLQRAAMSGDGWRAGDCKGCPVRKDAL